MERGFRMVAVPPLTGVSSWARAPHSACPFLGRRRGFEILGACHLGHWL